MSDPSSNHMICANREIKNVDASFLLEKTGSSGKSVGLDAD